MLDKYYNGNPRCRTERALELINRREEDRGGFEGRLAKLKEQVVERTSCRALVEGVWARVQMVAGAAELYELCPSAAGSSRAGEGNVMLKIVIKGMSGMGVSLAVSSRRELVGLRDCDYKVASEKILKIKNPRSSSGKTYLTVHSPTDLTLFRLRYEFQREGEAQRSASLKSSSVKLININSIGERSNRQQMLLNLKKGSPRSIVASRLGMQSARSQTIEREKERLTLAKQKRGELQVYRQKSKSFKIISHQCGSILKEYQQQLLDQQNKRALLTRSAAVMVYAVRFVMAVHSTVQGENEGLQKARGRMKVVRRCADKFMGLLRQLKQLQPLRIKRELVPVYHHAALAAKSFYRRDSFSAMQIVTLSIEQTLIAVSLNRAFECAGVYRRKVRAIQRFWLQRNRGQMRVFQMQVERHVGELVKKQPKFGVVREEFAARGMVYNLGWQYLKEGSGKIRGVVAAYRAKLGDIEEVKRINTEIAEANRKALKKHQKPLLALPDRPCRPQFSYFRDLGVLKAMVRSWFQIQYRRYVNKMKKQNSIQKQK